MHGLPRRRGASMTPDLKLIRPHQNGAGNASSVLVAVLEGVWEEIRRRHPDVPAVVVTVGAGSIGAPRGGLKLGHYAAARWRPAVAGEDVPAIAELFTGGEGLARGAVDVLGTLLHEAAHGRGDDAGDQGHQPRRRRLLQHQVPGARPGTWPAARSPPKDRLVDDDGARGDRRGLRPAGGAAPRGDRARAPLRTRRIRGRTRYRRWRRWGRRGDGGRRPRGRRDLPVRV